MPSETGERPLGELLGDLVRETNSLVRAEVQLAKTEITEKATEAAKDAGLVGAGAVVAHAGFLAILAGIIIALGEVMPIWAAALIIGVIIAGVGSFLAQKGLVALKRLDVAPRETVQTIKEDKLWAQQQMR
jgi:hypothetical protein